MFKGIKDTFKKSEAAVVVQNLLEHQAKVSGFEFDPAKFANALVQRVWIENPDLFNGKFGPRPHKISLAAAALSFILTSKKLQGGLRDTLTLSLGNLLLEVGRNGMNYQMNSVDEQLLEHASSVIAEPLEETEKSAETQREHEVLSSLLDN